MSVSEFWNWENSFCVRKVLNSTGIAIWYLKAGIRFAVSVLYSILGWNLEVVLKLHTEKYYMWYFGKQWFESLKFDIGITFCTVETLIWIYVPNTVRKVLNSIIFGTWGWDRAGNPQFGMRIFDVVLDRQSKGFFSKFEQN